MKAEAEIYLILGVTNAGRTFRPSDWAERLCGAIAGYDCTGRWVYSDHAQPVIHQGQIGVRVEKVLQEINPAAYQFMLQFASNNQLKILPESEVIHLRDVAAAKESVLPVRKLTFAV
ncbi:MAG: DUF3579 domain-containing protein [Gammaproteobacteria bacterium]|nr:MAG: DUF3579 domain-containing protein [Gammaproteobacteria bacterium]